MAGICLEHFVPVSFFPGRASGVVGLQKIVVTSGLPRKKLTLREGVTVGLMTGRLATVQDGTLTISPNNHDKMNELFRAKCIAARALGEKAEGNCLSFIFVDEDRGPNGFRTISWNVFRRSATSFSLHTQLRFLAEDMVMPHTAALMFVPRIPRFNPELAAASSAACSGSLTVSRG